MTYRNYVGTVEYSEEDGCYFGKIIDIRSLILYEGKTPIELKKNFETAVDEYLEDCRARGIEPESYDNVGDE